MHRTVVVLLFATAALLTAAGARAQATALSEARAAYESADFPGALAALDRAEQQAHLSRAELIELLTLRAHAELGVGARAPLDRTLTRLLSLDPAWSPGPAAPRFLEIIEEVRARGIPRLEVLTSEVTLADGTRVEARAIDPGLVVRGFRIHWTAAGDSAPHVLDAASAVIPAGARFRAEALGPGGASLGQTDEIVVLGADAPEDASAPPRTEPRGGDDTVAIVLGVVGGLVLAGAAVTVGVVLASGQRSDQTMLVPVVSW